MLGSYVQDISQSYQTLKKRAVSQPEYQKQQRTKLLKNLQVSTKVWKWAILTKMENIGFTGSHLASGVYESQWKQLKPDEIQKKNV